MLRYLVFHVSVVYFVCFLQGGLSQNDSLWNNNFTVLSLLKPCTQLRVARKSLVESNANL